MLPEILATLRNAAKKFGTTSGKALGPLAKGMQRAASFFGQKGLRNDWAGRSEGPAPVPLSQTPFAGLQSPPEVYRGQEINPPTGAPQPPSWGPPDGQGPPPPPSPPLPPRGGSNALVPQGPFPIYRREPGGKEDDTIHVLFPETGTALQASPPSRKPEKEKEKEQEQPYVDDLPRRSYDFDKTLPISPPSPGVSLQGQLSHQAPELLDTGTDDDLFQRAPVGSQAQELEYYRRTRSGFTPEIPPGSRSPDSMFSLPAPSPDGSMSFDWVNPEYARVEDKSNMEMASYFHAIQGEIGKLRAEIQSLKASMPVPSPVRIQ